MRMTVLGSWSIDFVQFRFGPFTLHKCRTEKSKMENISNFNGDDESGFVSRVGPWSNKYVIFISCVQLVSPLEFCLTKTSILIAEKSSIWCTVGCFRSKFQIEKRPWNVWLYGNCADKPYRQLQSWAPLPSWKFKSKTGVMHAAKMICAQCIRMRLRSSSTIWPHWFAAGNLLRCLQQPSLWASSRLWWIYGICVRMDKCCQHWICRDEQPIIAWIGYGNSIGIANRRWYAMQAFKTFASRALPVWRRMLIVIFCYMTPQRKLFIRAVKQLMTFKIRRRRCWTRRDWRKSSNIHGRLKTTN